MTVTRILTTPVRLTGSIHPEQLASLVAIDEVVRGRRSAGEETRWQITSVSGDAAVQRAVQQVVAREGDDKEDIGRENFAARAKQLQSEAFADLSKLFEVLGIGAELQDWKDDENTRVARIAFVRLYEAGALKLTETVVDSCPSCETVVDDADADDVQLEVKELRV